MDIRKTSYTEILDAPNVTEVLDAYAAESSLDELGPYNPQRGMYDMLERAGLLHVFAAHDGDKLIGFVSVLINVLPHYGRRVAVSESLFVLKAYRSGGAGIKLLRHAEKFAKEAGASGMLVSAPAGGKLEKLLPGLKYRHSNTVFVKAL